MNEALNQSYLGFFYSVAFCAFYFLPTIIAFTRKHRSKYGIMAMNILLGWTAVFWIWSLIWSLGNKGYVSEWELK